MAGLEKRNWMTAAGKGVILTALAAFLIYRSFWGMLLGVWIVPLCVHRERIRHAKERKQNNQKDFLVVMQSAAGALEAGYSLEQSWFYAQTELGRLYGAEGVVYLELEQMNRKIRMNEPLERLLYDFALRCGSEEICNFAEILLHVKRTGGNIPEIIRSTAARMQEKNEILQEIETTVAAKRAEQRMMTILAPMILLFVTISSPEYVSALYGNPGGILVMSACLAGYVIACRWSEKLTDIPV